jgi:hypothetical protein
VCLLLLIVVAGTFAARKTAGDFSRMVFEYIPVALVMSCAAFLGASYPFVQAARAFASNPLDLDAMLRVASLQFSFIFYNGWYHLTQPLYLWWGVVVLGTMLCLWIGSRAMRRQGL